MKRSRHLLILTAMLLQACAGDEDRIATSDAAPTVASTSSAATTRETGVTSGEITAGPYSDTNNTAPSPIIVRGSGAFIQSGATEPSSADEDAGDITLNFVDADIKEVIKGILGDILHLNYVIDPNVVGVITIKTNAPLARSELLPTLEQVLASNGIALIARDGAYTVSLLQDIRQTPLIKNASKEGYGNQVVRLRYVSAAEMATILNQYSQAESVKTIASAPNLLLLTGTGPGRATLAEIINIFDIDRFSGMSFGIFPLAVADPQTVIAELSRIFSVPGSESASHGELDFLPITRLNAVMVITSNPARLDQVQTWISRLDQSEPTDEPHLYVHYVQHGEAAHIAQVLQSIFGAETQTIAQQSNSGATDTSGSATDAFNSSSLQPSPPSQPALDQYDMPSSPTGITSVASTTLAYTPPAGKSKIRIIADDSNNALFVIATPREYKLIDGAIAHLDVTPIQVMIEATIAEVTLNNTLKYGVQWFFKEGNHEIRLSDVATGVVAPAFPGFGYVFATNDAKVVISALDKVTDVKVISSPQIMVLDNKTAKLQVGDQVPIATQSAVSIVTPDAPVVNSIEYKDTGVILTVTPRVNSSGTVGLDIEQEVSDVVPTTTSTLDSPTIQQRKLKSAVTVEDGQTIALGGLIRDSETKGKSGIPLLSDIPVLGALFGTTTNTDGRTELLVLLTPHVVRSPGEAQEITDELRKRVEAVTLLNQRIQ